MLVVGFGAMSDTSIAVEPAPAGSTKDERRYLTFIAVRTLSTLSLDTTSTPVSTLFGIVCRRPATETHRLQAIVTIVVEHPDRVIDEELPVLHDDAVGPPFLRRLEEVGRLFHSRDVDLAGFLAGLAQRGDDAGARVPESNPAMPARSGMSGQQRRRHLRRLGGVAVVVLVGDELIFVSAVRLTLM